MSSVCTICLCNHVIYPIDILASTAETYFTCAQDSMPPPRSFVVTNNFLLKIRLLTGAVHLLDILFRFAHKLSQKVLRSFKSLLLTPPRAVALRPAQISLRSFVPPSGVEPESAR